MSASEKLKALETGRAERVEAVSAAYADTWFLNRALEALPQIVAVVEAAEDLLGPAPSPGYIREGLGAALAALEEALK